MLAPPFIDILGVPVAAINLERARDLVIDLATCREGGYICVTGAHGVIEAQDDDQFRGILRGSHFNTPDGMPNVWIGRYVYRQDSMDRVYGPDLMESVFAASAKRPLRHLFYGGNDGVAEQLRDRLLSKHPRATVSGTYCPPFRELTEFEEQEVCAMIEMANPDIVWVGLSTPKQARFMAKFSERLPGRLMIGVGAAFDIHAGLQSSAPRVVQRAGLEWLWRLCQEPARLFPRYRKIVPRFIIGTGRQILQDQRRWPLSLCAHTMPHFWRVWLLDPL